MHFVFIILSLMIIHFQKYFNFLNYFKSSYSFIYYYASLVIQSQENDLFMLFFKLILQIIFPILFSFNILVEFHYFKFFK